MSFFDKTKNAGLLLIIIGILSLILGILSLFISADGTKISFGTDVKLAGIMSMISCILSGIIMYVLGSDIRKGKCRIQIAGLFKDVSSKYGVLTAIVGASGIEQIISAICTFICGDSATGIVYVCIAIVFIACASLMASNKAGKIVWVILLIVFIIGFIASLIASFAIVGIPLLLLYIMLLVFLFSPEIKGTMS